MKNVMITGAGSGFGKHASIALAARGHHVIATTETDEQAAELRSVAPQLTVERVDITNSSDVAKTAAWEIDVLTEAETTTENNFVPPDAIAQLGGPPNA